MSFPRLLAGRTARCALAAALLASVVLPAQLSAQRADTPSRPQGSSTGRTFDLFAVVDWAATGVRASVATHRFFVTNSGPMDLQSQSVVGVIPASAARSGTMWSQFPEITLFATAAPGDRAANLARVPSLSNVRGGGAALSYNFHKDRPGTNHWYAADGALGFMHSGVRTSTAGCLAHTSHLPNGVPLMPASDCPETWGLNGWLGARPIPPASWATIFAADRNGFRFDFTQVPSTLQDTSNFLGDRFQTWGYVNDYSRERLPAFGNVIPGGAGAATAEGYPLGLEWKFDAFAFSEAALAGVVFWQATVTNKSAQVYGTGLDYDSLYLGIITRHGRRVRTHAGFDPSRGTAFFNEIGNDDVSNAGGCDGALPVPGGFASDAFNGTCSEPVAFGAGASAIVMLKSPIGDLRYKQFSAVGNPFFNATSPVRGDTITFNIGRMCGDDCIAERAAVSATAGFGVVASREKLALNGEQPTALSTLAYWMLFHPANGSATDASRRVDPDNPRAGGGFNFTPLPGWRYNTRPASAPATGSDTLWLDTCNPTLDPATTPVVVPQTRAQFGRCVGRWTDTLPDRTLNFTRGATWLGAGPVRLPAGATTTFTFAIVAAGDSTTVETSVDRAISLYQSFYVTPTPIPQPRIVSVQANGINIRQSQVRIWFDNRAGSYVDPFILQLADQFRTAGTTGTSTQARLNRMNPRIFRAGVANDTGLTIADTLRILASRQLLGHVVYKSCNPGSGRYTKSTSPNICTNDRLTDSLNNDLGPAPYQRLAPLVNVDSQFVFTDGNVLPGVSYQYVIVAASRGAQLQLVTDTTVTAGGVARRIETVSFVASRQTLPALLSAPNVATVYVPASVQAGGRPARVIYRTETGAQTFDGDSLAYAGPAITVADTLSDTLSYRLVFGDSLKLREYRTSGGIDSTVVVVYRTAPIGFTFAGTDPIGRTATPTRRALDSLVFVRRGAGAIGRSIVGNTAAGLNTVVETNLGGGRTVTVTTLRNTGGALSPASGILNAPTTIVGPLVQGVLVQHRDGQDVPVIVGNDFRAGTFGVNQRLLGTVDWADAIVDIQNRPVVTAFSAANHGGVQIIESFFRDPQGFRFAAAAAQSAVPTVGYQTVISRFIGTAWGEFVFRWFGEDFGPGAPFTLRNGTAALQQTLDASLAARPVGSQTDTTAAVRNAIVAALGATALPATDSLIAVNLPFRIVDNSTDRASGGREVIAAIRASDKFYSPQTLPAGGIGAVAARWHILGSGIDTARVTIPQNQWVPGEPLILLERVRVADTTGGVVRRDASGNVVYRDTLLVIASRISLGCRATFPAICNPLIGPGGTGHSPTQQGYELVVRTAIPLTSDREVRFEVAPAISGTRVASVSRAQLDSVRVVPNPYVMYSSFEQGTGNEQRIMFTHLPPEGTVRIYTATGQFVQQIRWTPADLKGNGDMYFNLLTREGTLMASGLYLFTVEANGAAGGARRKQVGRFIIIR
jgi:hypothetical protein